MLETITPEHQDIRQISIYLPFIPRRSRFNFGVDHYETRKWSRLDCLLVQFWESRSIRPRVVIAKSLWTGTYEPIEEMKARIGCFLPQITARGIIDLLQEY